MSALAPDARFVLAAEILRVAMEDIASGIACGLFDEQLQLLRKPSQGKRAATKSKATELEMLGAAAFLQDGRAELLCDIVSIHAPSCAITPSYLRRRAVQLARDPDKYMNARAATLYAA